MNLNEDKEDKYDYFISFWYIFILFLLILFVSLKKPQNTLKLNYIPVVNYCYRE